MITLVDYLESMPDGYIPNKTRLLERAKQKEQAEMQVQQAPLSMPPEAAGLPPEVPAGMPQGMAPEMAGMGMP
jgi:hypothetical protein